jgi:hypothetical protein
VFSEFVDQSRQGKDVEGPADEAENNAPDDESNLQPMLETENCQSQVGKYAGLGNEGQRSHCLLHCDLSDGGQVEMSVVRHHNSAEQNCHYSCEKNHHFFLHNILDAQQFTDLFKQFRFLPDRCNPSANAYGA